ncbi:MAG: hypothetical protein WBF90_09905 [Rivularia sp. (in: cyanobacteria)]|jgi:hypothetical protein
MGNSILIFKLIFGDKMTLNSIRGSLLIIGGAEDKEGECEIL